MSSKGKDGDTVEWVMADPSRLVQLTLDRSPQLQDLYCQAFDKHGCSERNPWRVLVGFDEFTPGLLGQANSAAVREFPSMLKMRADGCTNWIINAHSSTSAF